MAPGPSNFARRLSISSPSRRAPFCPVCGRQNPRVSFPSNFKKISIVLHAEIHSYRLDNDGQNTVVFEIHLSRKVLYYAVNLILPCALISFLAPLSFLIPIEAGDRIGLGE